MSDGVTPTNFQVALAAGGTAQGIEPESATPGAQAPVFSGASIKALKANVGPLYIGGTGVTSATGYELQPSEAVSLDMLGLGKLFFIGANTGDKLCVLGVGP